MLEEKNTQSAKSLIGLTALKLQEHLAYASKCSIVIGDEGVWVWGETTEAPNALNTPSSGRKRSHSAVWGQLELN